MAGQRRRLRGVDQAAGLAVAPGVRLEIAGHLRKVGPALGQGVVERRGQKPNLRQSCPARGAAGGEEVPRQDRIRGIQEEHVLLRIEGLRPVKSGGVPCVRHLLQCHVHVRQVRLRGDARGRAVGAGLLEGRRQRDQEAGRLLRRGLGGHVAGGPRKRAGADELDRRHGQEACVEEFQGDRAAGKAAVVGAVRQVQIRVREEEHGGRELGEGVGASCGQVHGRQLRHLRQFLAAGRVQAG
mmetsp:Transcript_20178/g.60423  ORF Transcript_20178/g.60423 Transcript_20178/m.60423 type:complete len:240 (-) Transcript_20178:265-984(-)